MHPLILLSGALAWAGPTWPRGADVVIDTRQLLYDEPATTPAELERRERSVGVGPRWPAADGAVGYLVRVDGVVVVALPAATRQWSGEAELGDRLEVVAVDEDGAPSAALVAQVPVEQPADLLPAPGSGPVVFGLVSGSPPPGHAGDGEPDEAVGRLLGGPPPIEEEPAPAADDPGE